MDMQMHMSPAQRLNLQYDIPTAALIGIDLGSLEDLLQECLDEVKEYAGPNKGSNFAYTPRFQQIASGHRGSTDDRINILVDGAELVYNPEILGPIHGLLDQFVGDGSKTFATSFSATVRRYVAWMSEFQLDISRIAMGHQAGFMSSRIPYDLVPLTRTDIAEEVGTHFATVSRAVKGVTIALAEGNVIGLNELIPADKLGHIRGCYALGQLRKDPEVYDSENQKWLVSDTKLVAELKRSWDITIARRTASKYRALLDA